MLASLGRLANYFSIIGQHLEILVQQMSKSES
jgi:hypothetical protein